jgi:hypothetical protein
MNAQMPLKHRRRKAPLIGKEKRLTTAPPSSILFEPAPVAAIMPLSLSTVVECELPSHEQIAKRAYQIWEANGCLEGNDCEDWLLAEALLRIGA